MFAVALFPARAWGEKSKNENKHTKKCIRMFHKWDFFLFSINRKWKYRVKKTQTHTKNPCALSNYLLLCLCSVHSSVKVRNHYERDVELYLFKAFVKAWFCSKSPSVKERERYSGRDPKLHLMSKSATLVERRCLHFAERPIQNHPSWSTLGLERLLVLTCL